MTQTINLSKIHPYIGGGPYCYSNSLASMLGTGAPSPAVIETLTGAPFGFQLLAGSLPLFDPYGWEPDIGLNQAIGFLGYTCIRHTFETAEEAMAALADHLQKEPVLIGPLDMGLLLHQPSSDRASGADHFVVALEVQNDTVAFHDPQGHPWASLPIEAFCEAWRGEQIGYLEGSYAMRTDFEVAEDVEVYDAIRASLPTAAAWLAGRDLPTPPGTLGGREGLERLADMVAADLDEGLRQLLINFSLRLGARRKADAAQCLHLVGESSAASVFQEQARILGSLQYTAVKSDGKGLAEGFRQLGDLHDAAEECLS